MKYIGNIELKSFNGTNITEYREGDDIIPILLRANDNERFNLDRLRTASVFSNTLVT